MLTACVRNRIACYAAAITIILQQLSSIPNSTVRESPNPLVRVRESMVNDSDWHPDELFLTRTGERRVLVWEGVGSETDRNGTTGILLN